MQNAKSTRVCLLLLLASISLTGCGFGVSAPLPPLLAPAAAPLPATTQSVVNGAASPEAAYRAYFAALQSGDHASAAAWLSDYSLRVEGLTRADVQERLQMGVYGALRYLDLRVRDVRPIALPLDEAPTAIIHTAVTLQQGVTAPRTEEQWHAARYEDGGWRVNAGDLIDAGQTAAPAQTRQGVTVRLAGLQRYTTHTRLILEATNTDGQVARWGGQDAALALTVDGVVQTLKLPEFRFDAGQTYPHIVVDVDGSLAAYPSRVELAGWSHTGADPGAQWSYAFETPTWRAAS